MAKKKRFVKEDYAAIKQLLSDNGIDTKKLNKYEEFRKYRWMRHSEQIDCTDEEIEKLVNNEITLADIKKGVNWKEPDVTNE